MMMIFDDDDQHDGSTHHDARFPAFAHSFAFEFPFIVSHAFAFIELELARGRLRERSACDKARASRSGAPERERVERGWLG